MTTHKNELTPVITQIPAGQYHGIQKLAIPEYQITEDDKGLINSHSLLLQQNH